MVLEADLLCEVDLLFLSFRMASHWRCYGPEALRLSGVSKFGRYRADRLANYKVRIGKPVHFTRAAQICSAVNGFGI